MVKYKVSSTSQHFVIRHSLFDILRFELRQSNIQQGISKSEVVGGEVASRL